MTDLSFLPIPPKTEVDRWDREWMNYFATEDMSSHIVESDRLKTILSLDGMPEQEVFNAILTSREDGVPLTSLHVWVSGDELVNKNVVEIGCGCGWLGKQLGLICNSYLGIDVSRLALAIARGNSPRNCTYVHLSDHERLARFKGSMDTMVGREFFIHQNFDNAVWVLQLGAFLLKPGGRIAADFYMPNKAIPQGVVHPAKSPLDKQYASCAFSYSKADIGELAERVGLSVVSTAEDYDYQRRFVTFQKAR